jgi:hypothetical protein
MQHATPMKFTDFGRQSINAPSDGVVLKNFLGLLEFFHGGLCSMLYTGGLLGFCSTINQCTKT